MLAYADVAQGVVRLHICPRRQVASSDLITSDYGFYSPVAQNGANLTCLRHSRETAQPPYSSFKRPGMRAPVTRAGKFGRRGVVVDEHIALSVAVVEVDLKHIVHESRGETSPPPSTQAAHAEDLATTESSNLHRDDAGQALPSTAEEVKPEQQSPPASQISTGGTTGESVEPEVARGQTSRESPGRRIQSSALAADQSLQRTQPSLKRSASEVWGSDGGPAKRQSKWSKYEDSVMVKLRGEGMKWEDISAQIPGRSAISCRLHYQNFLERRAEWDEEKKNQLARLYERYKKDMWAHISKDMGIPWRAVEAMHWELGGRGIADRAGVAFFPASVTTPVHPQEALQRQPVLSQYHLTPASYPLQGYSSAQRGMSNMHGPPSYAPPLQPATFPPPPSAYPPPQSRHPPSGIYSRPPTPPPGRSPPSPARMRRSVSSMPSSAILSPGRRRSGSFTSSDRRHRDRDIPPVPALPQFIHEHPGISAGGYYMPTVAAAPQGLPLPPIHTITNAPLPNEYLGPPAEPSRYTSPDASTTTQGSGSHYPLQLHHGGEVGGEPNSRGGGNVTGPGSHGAGRQQK